jgi:hypothetical protein
MSQKNVEIVRRSMQPYDGVDVMPAIRASLERFGPDPQPGVVLAQWAEIELEVTATGAFGASEHGGRGGIPVEMRTFELRQVRDGKVARYRGFLSEAEALESADLTE